MLWTGPRRVDSLSFVQRSLARRVTRQRLSSVELNRFAGGADENPFPPLPTFPIAALIERRHY
jgi:hypothetical protein